MSTKNYTVLHPIAYAGRRERGEVVSMDEDTAAGYGPYYLKLKEVESEAEGESEPEETAPPEAEGESEPEDEYEAYSYDELKAEAKERGLKASGSSEDIRERLREYDAQPAEE